MEQTKRDQPQTLKMKQVRFNKVVTIKVQRRAFQIDRDLMWYSGNELDKMRQREKRLSQRVTDLEHQEGRIVYVHGLGSAETRRRRRAVIRQGQLLVLMIQEELWEVSEEQDVNELALTYAGFTSQYAQAAHIAAISYATETYTSNLSLSPIDKDFTPRNPRHENTRCQTVVPRNCFVLTRN